MTKRHNNLARIIVQAIEVNNRKNIIKSTTEQYIHWNQEIRLPDNIKDPRLAPDTLKDELMQRKPDLWFYTIKRNGSASELKLNLVEVTIPWGDVEINEDKFEKNADGKYVWRPFKTADVFNNTLRVAREKKMDKYEEIVRDAKEWLERNKDDIAMKYKVNKIEVDCSYIIISNLGMVPK
jgi:hypothetical protein